MSLSVHLTKGLQLRATESQVSATCSEDGVALTFSLKKWCPSPWIVWQYRHCVVASAAELAKHHVLLESFLDLKGVCVFGYLVVAVFAEV